MRLKRPLISWLLVWGYLGPRYNDTQAKIALREFVPFLSAANDFTCCSPAPIFRSAVNFKTALGANGSFAIMVMGCAFLGTGASHFDNSAIPTNVKSLPVSVRGQVQFVYHLLLATRSV
mgnify:CR=1 FL=1